VRCGNLPRVSSRTTRRRFVLSAGASASALVGLDELAVPQVDDRPNVVLIIVDTLRADHVFGKRARTPNIDALARQGLSFTRFYPEAMPTVPARRSILTGRRVFPFRGWHPYPGLLAEPGWAPIADVRTTFTSALRRAGYWTAYVTDNTSLGFSPPWGAFRRSFDRFVRRGGQIGGTDRGVSESELRHWLPPQIEDPETRDRIRRYLANGRYANDETNSFAARVFRDAARVLETAQRRRPFALVVDTFEPHEPWTPPRRYIDMYGDPDYHGPEPARPYYAPVSRYLHGGTGQVLLERMRALYAAEVTMTDRWLGVFLDRFQELDLEPDTVVVLVSDHGFYLGDHGFTGKIANVLHPPLIRVPLIVIDPRRRHAGRTSTYLASTHDVGPTILSMAGVPVPRGMDGVDLSRFFDGRRPPRRPYAFGGYGNSYFIRTDRWAMYGLNTGGGYNLFDRRRDPGEGRNVAGVHPGKAGQLHSVVRRRAGWLPTFPY
jgi:arylsulfatase A-like enzyme